MVSKKYSHKCFTLAHMYCFMQISKRYLELSWAETGMKAFDLFDNDTRSSLFWKRFWNPAGV